MARQEVMINDLAHFKDRYRHMTVAAVVGYLQQPAERIEKNILASLRFAEINHRYDEVSKEYESTCEWVFKDSHAQQLPWDSLTDWLKQSSGVYWIQGKAASGKSTIMKYLWDSNTTEEHLDTWRGGAAIASAVFFLWGGGTLGQRSHTGLSRSLLHSVLKWRNELISEVFPEEWARKSKEIACNSQMARDKWSLGRLRAAFEKLVGLASGKLKMCFFIDGLDEYDGDAAEIAEYIYTMSQRSVYVKFCVSSRPWPVFKDIFQGALGLKVQDFNRSDIDHYVRQNLRRNTHWTYLSNASPSEAAVLMQEVVQKADGVFLWVVLVIRPLITGLRNGDEFLHLRHRLAQLPAELEGLFDVLMGQIGSQDRIDSSKIFQIFRAARQQLDILTLQRSLRYSNVQDVQGMPLSARVANSQESRQLETTTSDLSRFWARVNSRTAGMLESPSPAWNERWLRRWETKNPLFVHIDHDKLIFQRVCYLHRTVKDYLERPEVWGQIIKLTDEFFDPNTALLMAFVVEAKTVGLSLDANHICDVGLQLFQKAAQLSTIPSERNDKLVEHLDGVLTHCASIIGTGTTTSYHHWSSLSPWDSSFYGDIKSVARATGLTWYIGTDQRTRGSDVHEECDRVPDCRQGLPSGLSTFPQLRQDFSNSVSEATMHPHNHRNRVRKRHRRRRPGRRGLA